MTKDNLEERIRIRSYATGKLPAVVVTLLTDLDMPFSYKLQDFLIEKIRSMEPFQELYIDLSNVEYIPSLGVGALSTALVASMKKNISFYLCNIKPKVRSVFEMLGLMPYFTEKTPDV